MTAHDDAIRMGLGMSPRTPEVMVLRLLVETGVRAVGGDEGSLLVYDPDRNDLTFVMTYGGVESEEVLLGQRVPLGRGLTGLAAQTGEVQIGAPVYTDIEQSQSIGAIRSVLAAPMMLDDRLIGVITAISHKGDKRFSIDDAKLYGGVATIAALVVDQNLRLRLHAGDDSQPVPASLGATDPAGRELVERVGRILTMDPLVVQQAARMLETVEALGTQGMQR